ncbi:MAG: PAC2 family protein [Actinomycetia bacterium]|nr:PAC2 family protein [Actinomycetes bacterium]
MSTSWRSLNHPVVVVAFSGWNDAADAASAVLDHLADSYPTEALYTMPGEDYYDYQATRPTVERTPGGREITWPAIEFSVTHLPRRDLVLVGGPEPNLRWPTLCGTLTGAFRMMKPDVVVLLGAMLTDVPHTRALPVTGLSNDAALVGRLHLSDPDYEGPTGIIGVLYEACLGLGRLKAATLWASVPYYTASAANPKATLGLLGYLEDILGDPLELGDLPSQARDWEQRVSELVDDDPDLAAYIAELEEQADTEDAPGGTGEALAAEFERYLRHIG